MRKRNTVCHAAAPQASRDLSMNEIVRSSDSMIWLEKLAGDDLARQARPAMIWLEARRR
jgi:hypothetical protein